ncbi:MAG: CapA family protein [Eubacteriales bacterium]|nr:CapA family protein [Eubacteriales bacterium]
MKKKEHLPLNYIEKNNVKISFLCSILTLIVLFFLFRQLDYQLIEKPKNQAIKQAQQEQEEAERIANTPVVTEASVIAVGDNLYHDSLLNVGSNNNWNYDSIYQHVTSRIQNADIAMIDQETVFTTNHDVIAGYPSFATPTEVGDSIIRAGFNVIESATNHIDDYGVEYIQQTLDYWKNNYPSIPVLGIHESQEDADTVKTMTVNDITFSFLNYTYGTNSGIDTDHSYMIDILEQQKVAQMCAKAKEQSEVLIFVAHWGKEDEHMPTEHQKQWANFLMKQGVDVVIGGHPHVIQPYGYMSDNEGHKMLIYYSLGNFVSTQQKMDELLEAMASFTVRKTVLKGEKTIEIVNESIEPMVMHYNSETGEYGPYMLSDYTEELASAHGVRDYVGEVFTLENLKKKFSDVMAINVEPSTKTTFLDVRFTTDGNMEDKKTGDWLDDYDSITAETYWKEHNITSVDTGSQNSSDDYDSDYDSDYDYSYDSDYDSDDSY